MYLYDWWVISSLIENSKEKKLEQILAEKFLPMENKNQQSTKPRKEIFPWLQEADNRQISTDTKNIDELISQKTRQAINSIRMELADYKSEIDRMLSKKSSQSDIDLIRSDLANYQSKLDMVASEKIHRKDIDSIKSDLAECKSNLELVASERSQKNDIASIRIEFDEYKSKLNAMVDEITVFLEVINSINEEISRLKNNLGSDFKTSSINLSTKL